MKIILENVGKRYQDSWIFRGLNHSFESAGVYGITGSNGSGKSTLLQVIAGFVTATEGKVTRNDYTGEEDDFYKSISLAAPSLDLFEEFSVAESITIHHRLKPLTGTDIPSLLEEINLAAHRDKQLSQLSSGMKQRLKLALAIYADTPLLLLDEPCSNLDAQWSQWFNLALSKRLQHRLVIICSNHQQAELQSVNKPILDLNDPC